MIEREAVQVVMEHAEDIDPEAMIAELRRLAALDPEAAEHAAEWISMLEQTVDNGRKAQSQR